MRYEGRALLLCLTVALLAAVSCYPRPDLDWPGTTRLSLPKDRPLDWPDWSPDSSRIVVVTAQISSPSLNDLLVVTVEDNTYVTPGRQSSYRETNWSPDGTRLVGSGWDGLSIVSFPDFHSGPRLDGFFAEWSPDGERLAIFRQGSFLGAEPSSISVSDLDGNAISVLFEDEPFRYNAYGGMDWSGANDLIAFSFGSVVTPNYTSLHRNIYVADAATGDVRVVSRSRVDDVSPSWSPDGEWLVYVASGGYPRGPGTITFAKSDGSCVIPALSAEWLNGVAWSPDGSKLAVAQDRSLYVVDIVEAFGDAFADLESLCAEE